MHPIDGPQQRGFSGAGAADDGYKLAVLNGEGHILQSDGPVGIDLGSMVKYNHFGCLISFHKHGGENILRGAEDPRATGYSLLPKVRNQFAAVSS